MDPRLDVHLEEGPPVAPNRRRHARVAVRALVLWDHRRQDSDTGTILDVSASGLLLTGAFGVPEDVRLGDPVWGRFNIGDAEHQFAAVVRWRGYSAVHGCEGVGVEFSELTPLARQDLDAFVARSAVADL